MYSRFCYYIQHWKQKRNAQMHIHGKSSQQIKVELASNPAYITDSDTGVLTTVTLKKKNCVFLMLTSFKRKSMCK